MKLSHGDKTTGLRKPGDFGGNDDESDSDDHDPNDAPDNTTAYYMHQRVVQARYAEDIRQGAENTSTTYAPPIEEVREELKEQATGPDPKISGIQWNLENARSLLNDSSTRQD